MLNHPLPCQVLFVKCNTKKQAMLTAKLVVARAKGIFLVDCAFLVKWETTGTMPAFSEFPVCLPSAYGNDSTVLPPLKANLLENVTLDMTGDLSKLLIPHNLLATVVEALGGSFVREGEARPPRVRSHGRAWVFVIGHDAEDMWPVYSDEWLLDMVLKGRRLNPATYRIVENSGVEEGCTQPVEKRHRIQV